MRFSVVSGFPETGPREPDPARAHQQAVPAAGPGEPHRLGQQAEAHGPRGQPTLGQSAEAGRGRPAATQSNLLPITWGIPRCSGQSG